MSVIKNIALVIVAPRVGWDEIGKSGLTAQQVQQRGYFPLLALLAAAAFVMPQVYDSTKWTLTKSLMHALAEFLSFYASFFPISYLVGGFFPNLVKTNSGRNRLDSYILYGLCFVAILEILGILLDNLSPLYFLLIYTFVITVKGTDYLGLDGKPWGFIMTTSIMVIFVPMAIRRLLEAMIL